jgi:hypothetical protein
MGVFVHLYLLAGLASSRQVQMVQGQLFASLSKMSQAHSRLCLCVVLGSYAYLAPMEW